ncbi:hydrogenase maturation peptidase HycI [Paludibacterium purpuratum]|uniref:Hydrogenase 3 maturation protease n=1 Tax=Paludibacterium purpuratum TaxID=1144873 RepID=A0A4R7B7D6_9NEIS|nr:hydrogenase maturation peptidase HycI [Paludibacterium purpuratum]TDR79675.1 hydrogenase 3 maturation protease [Paludibacterium purpuratum]
MTADNLILAVGNAMMGDDGAGPLLASLLHSAPAAGWLAIDGGSAPENVAHSVLAAKPRRVVVFDAADMGLDPGEIRLVDDRTIAEMFIMTTHNLPLNFLIERLREEIDEVLFLGVQPDVVAFYFPMTPKIDTAVRALHARLVAGQGLDGLAWLSSERP